ncbi:hypothetical protein [Ilumatobacter fluminis]|uniref:hypothetical protein n=1 Tax=Ilumatobacter fluminis TaxID=467091 RepID=UPI0032EC6981
MSGHDRDRPEFEARVMAQRPTEMGQSDVVAVRLTDQMLIPIESGQVHDSVVDSQRDVAEAREPDWPPVPARHLSSKIEHGAFDGQFVVAAEPVGGRGVRVLDEPIGDPRELVDPFAVWAFPIHETLAVLAGRRHPSTELAAFEIQLNELSESVAAERFVVQLLGEDRICNRGDGPAGPIFGARWPRPNELVDQSANSWDLSGSGPGRDHVDGRTTRPHDRVERRGPCF